MKAFQKPCNGKKMEIKYSRTKLGGEPLHICNRYIVVGKIHVMKYAKQYNKACVANSRFKLRILDSGRPCDSTASG